MIIVFTGNGKGKTSASIGVVIRSLGYNRKILFSQFLKSSNTGELIILKKYVDIERCGTKEFVNKENYNENKKQVLELLKRIINKHKKEKYDLIVLDELNLAIFSKFISIEDTKQFLNDLEQIKACDIIITGRYAKKEIIDIADMVTEMKEIKHPFKKGILAKKGIDY